MASMEEKYDTALIGILQNEGQIAKFLDVLLGFLYRRTDFFRIMKSENDKLGFPAGVAMKLLMSVFKKYEVLATQDETKRQKILKSKETQTSPFIQAKPGKDSIKPSSVSTASPPSESISPALVPFRQEHSMANGDRASEGYDMEKRALSNLQTSRLFKEGDNVSNSKMEICDSPKSKKEDTHLEVKKEKIESETAQGNQDDSEMERLQKLYQSNPESYNGAVREKYSWSQTITDLDVMIKVPSNIVKGKNVKVVIKKKHIHVSCQDSEGQWKNIVKGDLTWEVRAEESVWSLNPGQHVHVNLEKKEERWWEAVFVDEPKINTRKIDCSRSITDLDDEAQAKIEEMMYNEHCKRLGLPQSHEKKTLDMLRQAWDAEGSPFRGQKFDPSAISIDPSGTVKMK